MSTFSKWDIVYVSRYPESIKCSACNNHYTINPNQECSHCKHVNNVTNLIAKVRPMILWIDKSNWYKSMTFGIPLSTSDFHSDKWNHAINISDCLFFDSKYEKPMRAVICQATRADGNVVSDRTLVGKITDQVTRLKIENKLLDWLFAS